MGVNATRAQSTRGQATRQATTTLPDDNGRQQLTRGKLNLHVTARAAACAAPPQQNATHKPQTNLPDDKSPPATESSNYLQLQSLQLQSVLHT